MARASASRRGTPGAPAARSTPTARCRRFTLVGHAVPRRRDRRHRSQRADAARARHARRRCREAAIDVAFTMPATPVRLGLDGHERRARPQRRRRAPTPARRAQPGPTSIRSTYGRPAPTPFDALEPFDRRFELTITRKPGFFDGTPGLPVGDQRAASIPTCPMFVVEEGDLVEITITNDTKVVHPMHLHGHHVLVLSRDGGRLGKPVVVGHAERATRRELRRGVPRGQPGHLDGPLPQPPPRRRRAHDARRLRRRHDTVPGRRRRTTTSRSSYAAAVARSPARRFRARSPLPLVPDDPAAERRRSRTR